MPKVKMVCQFCRGENVTRDGILRWSIPEQKWEASSELDNTYCEDCDEECRLDEEELNDDGTTLSP